MHILLVGGGSGGHVYPLIAVANALRQKSKDKNISLELRMMGSGDFLRQAARESGILFTHVMSGKLRRYSSFKNFTDILKLPFGLIQALWHMFWLMPDRVFAKGGHASVLPVLAARFFLIPVYLHESDSVPGLANRILSRRARKIFISFSSAQEIFGTKKTVLVGNPVRPELAGADKNKSISNFNFDPNKKTIFVIGGSQGSRAINNAIMASLVQLVQTGYQIIHQCGQSQVEEIKSEIEKVVKEGGTAYGPLVLNQYKFFAFLDQQQLSAAYAASDVIISRAGGIIFELAMIGKPVILIPLPGSAGNHQLKNGLEFADAGAIIIEEQNLTSHILLNSIQSVLDPQVYGSICQKIKSFAKPDAAARIADELLS
jgi:UDP-N-acetylglucosamine--N-acetylmuramyl-(pentapeptide) pyrophosphoryl-undecaprenol N-acetylglucosamine transferase